MRNENTLNVIQITLGTGLYAIVLFVLRSVIGNQLGPDHLGSYSLLFIIYNFGFQFVALGMGVTLTKYISEYFKNPNQIKNIIGFGLFVSTMSGVIFSGISMGTSKLLARGLFHNESFYLPIIIVSISFPFISILQTSLGILNGFFKITRYTLIYIILSILTLIATLLGIYLFNDPTIGYSLGLCVPTIFAAVISIILILKHVSIKLVFKFPERSRILRFAILTVIINSIAFLNNQITSIVLGSYLTTTEVGILTAALTIVQGLMLFPYAAQRIVMPNISELYADNKWDEIRRFNRKAIISVVIVYGILAAILTIFARTLVNFIFSPDFSDSVLLLWILLPTSIIYSINATLGGVLAAIEKLKLNVIINGSVSIITLAFSVVFIIYQGTVGAAIATTIFYVLSSLINIVVLLNFKAI